MHNKWKREKRMEKKEVGRIVQLKESELIPIVAELADKYTGKESTSVSEETAKMLMEAVCYCIREAENENEPFQTAQEAYEKGYALVCEKRKRAEKLYQMIISRFQAYENKAYYDTIIKGIPAFFLRYNPKFKPQDHILTLDYPLLSDDFTLTGIDRIYDYLLKIRLEQRFLGKLSVEMVRQCLEEYWTGYEELFINICQVVLHSILKRMLKKEPETDGLGCEALTEKLRHLLRILIEQQYGGNETLYDYLAADLSEFAVVLSSSTGVNN